MRQIRFTLTKCIIRPTHYEKRDSIIVAFGGCFLDLAAYSPLIERTGKGFIYLEPICHNI